MGYDQTVSDVYPKIDFSVPSNTIVYIGTLKLTPKDNHNYLLFQAGHVNIAIYDEKDKATKELKEKYPNLDGEIVTSIMKIISEKKDKGDVTPKRRRRSWAHMKKCLFFIVLMMICLVSSVYAIDNSTERTPEEKKIDEMFIRDASKLDPADAMATAKLGDEYINKAMAILHRDITSMVHEGWEYWRKGMSLYEKASKIATRDKDLAYIYYHWAIELEWGNQYIEAWQKIKLARKNDASIIEKQFINKLSGHMVEPDNDVVAASPESLGGNKKIVFNIIYR